MAHINFLEKQRFGLRQFNLKDFELNYFWMMVMLGTLLAVMLTYGLVQRYRIGRINGELTAAIAEVKKTSGAQPVKPGAPQKPSILDSLLQRVVWSPILNAIANHTPDTIALNYVKGASLVNRGVQVEGVGADVLATVRYEEDLSTIPFFSKVFLKSSSDKNTGAPAGAPAPKSDAKPDAKPEEKPVTKATTAQRPTFEIQAWLK